MAPRGWGALVVAALVAAGCGSTSTYRVMLGMPGPAVAARTPVRITRGAALPGFRVTEVALVQAVGRGSHADLPHLAPGDTPTADRLLIELPTDIDHLLASDFAAALDWRERVRTALEMAFAAGYAITDAVFERGARPGKAFYVLDREGWRAWVEGGTDSSLR